MRPFELTLALRGQNAENRANVVRALTPAEVVEVDATLLAAVLVESSGVVRGVINERLAERPAEARAALSLPEGHIDLEGQQRLANRWASQPGFVEGLLAYHRGRVRVRYREGTQEIPISDKWRDEFVRAMPGLRAD